MVGVLVVDDHWVVHDGIERACSRTEDVRIVAKEFTLEGARDALTKQGPEIDVVLLDLVIGEGISLDSIADLKQTREGVKVLVLSMLPEDPYAVRSIEIGADGYVSKGGRSHELVDAVRTVASGIRHLTPSIAQLMAAHLGERKSLSPRELEIVRMLAEGRRPGQIATLLELSPKTVSTHKANAMTKLGIKSNAELIRWAMDRLLP